MSFTLQTSPTVNSLPLLSLTQQPYLTSTQSFIILPSHHQIIYHGYKHKNKEQTKTQNNAQKTIEQAKPKKKFNFKVTKNTQTKPIAETSQKVSIFQLQKNHWQSLELKGKPPIPRENHCLISLNTNTLILYGGKSLQNQKLLNDLHVLNIETLLWKKLFSIECPSLSEQNIIIKLTDTKIMLINLKQVWTFQSKDVKWQLNTNQLPGGLWENLQIKIESFINPQRQIILAGLIIANDEEISEDVLLFTIDKQQLKMRGYIMNLSNKEMNRVDLQKDILVDDLQGIGKKLRCEMVRQRSSNMMILSIRKKDRIEINLLRVDVDTLMIRNISSKEVGMQNSLQTNLNGQCVDIQNMNIYLLTSGSTNVKQRHLKGITFSVQKIQQHQSIFSNSQKKPKNQLSGYLSNSQIHSIPQESNQSSLIGIKNHQNQRYQQFQDQSSNYHHHDQHRYFMINSQRQNQTSSRPSSEVNRSPSVISNQQKSQISDQQQSRIQIPIIKQHHNYINQRSILQNKSNIYLSPRSQHQNPNQMQNNSSFPEQQYLQQKLQKILVFEHLKRQRLEQKSQFLQRSIKNSQTLAKLLTKFATTNQKNHHIDQVKYLKQQLQNIWNKQIFFRKQIHQNFANSQTQTNLRNSTQNQRHSRDTHNSKNQSKIDMKKLLQKHNLLQQQ